jgi:hypothetical protein
MLKSVYIKIAKMLQKVVEPDLPIGGLNAISAPSDNVIEIDYDSIESPVLLTNDPTKPYLFILDDVVETFILYSIDFKNINRLHSLNVIEDFNIVQCFGSKAGLIAHKYIELDGGKVDFAVLDITLGYVVKLTDGSFVEYDGVDIAIEILKHNKDAKIIFSTAHTMNKRNPDVARYINKFNNNTGLNIDNHYMNKNSDRVTKLYHFLYK